MICQGGQLNLGEVIDLLKSRHRSTDTEQSVRFDFGFPPRLAVHSYRGYYEDLALGVGDEGGFCPKVEELVRVLEDAVEKTFGGWKGGDYTMDKESTLWVANESYAHGVAIVGLVECHYMTILETKCVDP